MPFSVDRDVLLREVERVARKIVQHGHRASDGSFVWQGPTGYGTPGFPFRYKRLRPHIYDGSTGIALFLAAFGRFADDPSYGEIALAALTPLRRRMRGLLSQPEAAAKLDFPIGGFVGLGSFLYGLLWIGKLLGEAELVNESHRLTELFTAERIQRDRQTRVQTGSAGAILALLALQKESPEPNRLGQTPLEIAVACGEHLIEERVSFEGRPRAWQLSNGKPPLSGFSYGAAGVSFALLRLYGASGHEDFLATAREGLEFVRQLWVPERGNWRDIRPIFEASHETPDGGWRDWWTTGTAPLLLRTDGPGPWEDRFPRMWCHGSSGKILGRIAALDVNDDAQVREEIAAILAETRSFADTDEFDAIAADDLCCGHMGHIETLHTAYLRLGQEENLHAARTLAARTLDRIATAGTYTLSAARGRDTFAPSLFQGLAGLGYTLLRLAEPQAAPCVLILE